MFRTETLTREMWIAERSDRVSLVNALKSTRELVNRMWRIVRISDGTVIAFSKNAYAEPATPAPVVAAQQAEGGVTSEAVNEYVLISEDPKGVSLPFEIFGDYGRCLRFARKATSYQYTNWKIVRLSDDKVLTQNKYAPKTLPDPAPDKPQRPTMQTQHQAWYEKQSLNTDAIIAAVLDQWIATTESDPQPPTPKTTRLSNPGGGNIPNGHNRGNPRNRKNSAQFKAQRSHKVSFTMNGANIEQNTPKAQMWRNKRHLANRVAMPIPAITGAELMQQASLTLLPKRLTRVLESRVA